MLLGELNQIMYFVYNVYITYVICIFMCNIMYSIYWLVLMREFYVSLETFLIFGLSFWQNHTVEIF